MAGADWIVADALGVEALNPGPFAMVQDNLAAWLADPAGVRRGERGALDGLMRGLIMSGLAMQAHGNSRPASGSDHQFAHLWEMEEVAVAGEPVSHGACVGIGCLSMLAAYEWLLRQDLSRIAPAELAARTPSAAALRAEVAASFPLPLHGRQRRGRDGGQGRRTAGRRDTPAAACRRAGREIAARLQQSLPAAATVRRWLDAAARRRAAAAIGISATSTPGTTSAPG